MPKQRIVDERTGEPCDYAALAAECRALMENEGITWREAAERVAAAANSIRAESIVRNLNRGRPGGRSPRFILPGEAVLYDAIARRLDRLESRIEASRDLQRSSEDEPFRVMAEQAANLRRLLRRRARALEDAPEEEAIRAAGIVLGEAAQDSLTAGDLLQLEHGRLASLLARVRQLQYGIDSVRPGPFLIVSYDDD